MNYLFYYYYYLQVVNYLKEYYSLNLNQLLVSLLNLICFFNSFIIFLYYYGLHYLMNLLLGLIHYLFLLVLECFWLLEVDSFVVKRYFCLMLDLYFLMVIIFLSFFMNLFFVYFILKIIFIFFIINFYFVDFVY